MLPFNWPRWLRSQLKPRGRTYRKPTKHRRPLQLEVLEDRTLLATALPTVLPPALVSNQASLAAGTDPDLVQDPTNPQNLVAFFGGTKLGGQYSTNGGQTWNAIGTPANLDDPNLSTYQNPVTFAAVTNVTVGWDRAENLYVSFIECNTANTSGALVFMHYTFGAAGPTVVNINGQSTSVIDRWLGYDPIENPVIAVDDNVPVYNYTDPTNTVNTTQTDTMSLASGASKAVYIAYNTNNAAPTGATAAFNPNTIKVVASQDEGQDFTAAQFVNDTGFATNINSPSHYTDPQMVFTQGSANYGFGPAVVGGQLVFVWDDFGHNKIMVDSSQPDGGVASANVARDLTKTAIEPGAGANFPPATPGTNGGPNIPSVTDFPITVTNPGFTLGDLNVNIDLIVPNVQDISIALIAPQGQELFLVDNAIDAAGNSTGVGLPSGANMGVVNVDWPSNSPLLYNSIIGTTFDDNAARAINDPGAPAPYTGHFTAEGGSLAGAFGGMTAAQLTGTWNLEITNYDASSSPIDERLDQWTLNLTAKDISMKGFGTDETLTGITAPLASSAGAPYPLSGVGPYGTPGASVGLSVAVDNTLGGLSPYQGRLYIAYTGGSGTDTNVYLTSIDDIAPTTARGGAPVANPSVQVNDDTVLDGSEGDRPEFMPTVAVDALTGTVGVMYYDGRWDASTDVAGSLSRAGNSFSDSIDGGQTFSTSIFLNTPKTATDEITGQTLTLEPVPGNQGQANTFGFGERQGLVMYGGNVYPMFASNLNTTGSAVMTAAVTIAGGPRVLQGDMGPITADSTYFDANGNLLATYNNTFAPDGTRQLSAFVVQFDRPILVSSFTTSQVTIYYHDTTTPAGDPGVLIPATKVVPLDSDEDYVLNDLDGSTVGLLGTTFEVQFSPQSAVGTYSYAIGNYTGPAQISDGIPSVLNPGVPGNYMDQNQNAFTGEAPDFVLQGGVVDPNFDGSSGYQVGNVLTVNGGTADQPAELQVTSVGEFGNITGVSVYRPGVYTATPANPDYVTGGSGSGAALDLTWSSTTGDLFSVPQPTDGGPFQLPYSTDTLPLIIPGPHVSNTRIPTSYSVTDPVAIPANGTPVVSTLGITDDVTITSLAVEVNITYPTMGDLNITLTGPNGSTVPLVNAGNLSGANLTNTIFDDTADQSIYGGTAPYTGTFVPATSLDTTFADSSLEGTWQLSVSGGTTAGILNSWTLLPTGDTNLVLNGTNNSLEVDFDRDIQPNSFTSANILSITTPEGPLPNYNMTTPMPIPTASGSGNNITPGVLTSTISVPDSLLVEGLTVGLNITDANDSALTATLIAPDGTEIPLFDGGTGANFTNTIFDDNATMSIALGSGPYTGSYQTAGGVTGAAVAAGGTGYQVGDILTVVGGVFATPSTLQVTSVSKTGAVTGITVLRRGMYTADPPSPATVTGGNGTGATFTLTFNNNKLSTLNASDYEGNWQLVIDNNTPGNTGTLVSWSLNPVIVTPNFSVASATPASGGTGYQVGDVLNLVGGVSSTAAQLQVTSVNGSGAITGVAFNTAGTYSVLPPTTTGVTGGSGTGATFNLTFPPGVDSFTVTMPTQSLSGSYQIEIGPDAQGNYIKDTSLNSATIPQGDGGSGYVVGDIVTVTGGTFTTPAEFMVAAVNGSGAITAAELVQPGYYTAYPPLLNAVSGGTGSGAQLLLDFGNEADTNFNAGVDLLFGGSGNNGTILTNTYSSGTINTPIPHGSQISSQINVPSSFLVQGVTVTLTIKHQNDPDLTATLIAPDGTSVQLFSHVGDTGSSPHANFTGTTFSDLAPTPIQLASTVPGTGIGAGPYDPQFPLSTLDNLNALGNWTLQITSDSSTLNGTLVSWSINLNSSVAGSGLGEPVADRISADFRIFTQAPNNTVSQTAWTAVGPAPITGGSGTGPENETGDRTGRIGGIAVDPSDPSDNTVYVAGASGGVWKTTDFMTTDPDGPTYVPLTSVGPADSTNVGSIAVFGQDNNPDDSIVFVATGEGSTFGSYTGAGVGLLRSMDGGKTWELLDSTDNVDANGNILPINSPNRDHAFVNDSAFRVIVDPHPSPTGGAIVYVAMSGPTGGIWRSTNSGNTWTQILSGNATDVALASDSIASTGNLQILYGAIEGEGVYITTNAPTATSMRLINGGDGDLLRRDVDVTPDTAIPVLNDTLNPGGANGRITLATVPLTGNPLLLGTSAYNGNPLEDTLYEGWIYALVTTTGGTLEGIYVSKDFGENWTQIHIPVTPTTPAPPGPVPTNNETDVDYDPFGNSKNAQGNYDQVMTVDPNDPSVIYVGGSSDFSPYGFIRIDTSAMEDVYDLNAYDNSDNDNGLVELSTNGGVTISAAGPTSVTTGQKLGPGKQWGFLNPADPFAAPLNDYTNFLRDPENPFLTPSSQQFTNIANFTNTGDDVTWIPFDGGGLEGTDQHQLVALKDPTTGQTRIIFGDDQGIWTGTDDGSGNSVGDVGFASEINGSRNGNLQITQFYYGATQPSTLAAQVAGALFYGSAQDDGAPVSDPNVLQNGDLGWSGPGGDYAGVATDQTGTGTSYQYAWPCCGATPLASDFFLVTPPGGSAISRTTGLLLPGDDPAAQKGEWPYEGTINFAVNPIDPTSIVMSSAAASPGPDVFLTTGPSLGTGIQWFPIAGPGDLDGTQSVAMAFGAPANANAPTSDFIYVGTIGGHVYVTFTGGGFGGGSKDWTNISAGLDGSPVEQIVTDPNMGSDDAYCVTQLGVYYMPDAAAPGATWINITGNLFSASLSRVLFDDPQQTENTLNFLSTIQADWRYAIPDNLADPTGPTHPVLYVGGDGGVYRALIVNGDQTVWTYFPDSTIDGATENGGYLPTVNVTSLNLSIGNINPKTGLPTDPAYGLNLLVANTYGNGTFAIRLNNNIIVPGGNALYTYAVSPVDGPHVTGIEGIPNLANNLLVDGIEVDFSGPVDPATFTFAGINSVDGPNGQPIQVQSVVNINQVQPGQANPYNEYEIVFATPQSEAGFYRVSLGPNITDFAGDAMDQNQNGINGENPGDIYDGRFLWQPWGNTAPVLNTATATLPPINEDISAASNTGESVAAFVAGLTPPITDADTGFEPGYVSPVGIAITGVDDTNGEWQYSTDGGNTWTNIPAVADDSALLLEGDDYLEPDGTPASSDNYIRFQPNPGYPPGSPLTPAPDGGSTFTFRAWDLTSGLDTNGQDGTIGNASINGGTTAYSATTATASIDVHFVNLPPSYTAVKAATVEPEDVTTTPTAYTISGWVTSFTPGRPGDIVAQYITSGVTNPNLFSVQPYVDNAGNLHFTLAPGWNGTTQFQIAVQETGGSLYGGNDTSPTQTFTITVNPPTITLSPSNSTLANATAGATYSHTISGVGGFAPYSNFIILPGGSLPNGLTLSPSTGIISGTPTQAGPFNFTVQAQDSSQGPSQPYTGSQSYTLTVNPPVLTFSPSTLPNPTAGVSYSETIVPSGGTSTYSHFTVVPGFGTLPAGLTLSPTTGVLSGTPTQAGPFSFTIRVQDSTTGPQAPYTGAIAYTLSVAPPNISFTPSLLPNDLEGEPYSQTLTGSGGTPTYSHFTIVSGSLPSGVTLNSGGTLSGSPTAAGNFTFTVQAQDSTTGPNKPYTGTQSYTLSVIAPFTATPTMPLPNGKAGVVYANETLSAIAGTGPASNFTVSGNALPAGLTLSSAGVISGTPTQVGSFTFTVSASDFVTSPSTGPFTAEQQFTITTTAPNISFTPTAATATAGVSFSQALTGIGGTPTYSNFTVTGSNTLPAGLTLSPSGTISGTPSQVGNFTVSIQAQDSTTGNGSPFTGTQTFNIVVDAPTISFSPTTLTGITAGASYTQALTGVGGTSPYVNFTTIGPATLPAGLTLSPSGTFSGTPTQVGNFTITVTAQDSTTGNGSPFSGTETYTFAVAPPDIVFSPSALPLDVAGTAYSQALTPSGGTPTYSDFTVTSGSLPTGISLSPSGTLSGDTSDLGNFTFTVQAQDSTTGPSAPYTGSQTFTLQVVEPFTPVNLANVTAGATFAQTLSAANGTGPASNFSVSSGSLPAGVSLSTGGVLGGTPTQAGSFTFTVSANDSTPSNGSFVASQQFTLTVAGPTITLNPSSLAAATAGVTYTQALTATGGTPTYSDFTLTSGTLPAGVTLSQSGTFSGTPSQVGTFPITVQAEDSTTGTGAPFFGSQSYTLTVSRPNISFAPTALATATAGVSYSQAVTGQGGTPTYSDFTLTSGTLPTGVTLSQSGTFSGTPSQVGTFPITVQAEDSTTGTGAPFFGSQTYTLVVNKPNITFTPTSLTATDGATYSQAITATGGTPTYSDFTITGGTLPAGLSLSSSGTISGTPSQVGSFNITIAADDSTTGPSAPYSGSQTFSLTVLRPNITFTPSSLSVATAGVSYTQSLSVGGGIAPYGSFVLGAGSALPNGVTLSSSGVLSGTPTQAGSFTVIVQDHDSSTGPNAPYTGSQTYTLTVNGPTIVFTPSTLAGATAGVAYSASVTATGGTPTYSHFTVSSGALPTGLTLSSAGAVSGTPSAAGNFTFTITAQDSTTGPNAPYTGSQTYTLSVAAPTIAISPTSLPSGLAYAAYNQTLSGSGGTAPYSFTIASGSLPSGVSLSSGGVLSGTPTVAGNFTFTVQATDKTAGPNAPYSGSQNYTLAIATDPTEVVVNTSALPSAVTDQIVTFAATVSSLGPDPATPAGNVDFIIDGNTVASGVALVNGQASIPVADLTVDGSPHSVSVLFHDTDGLFSNDTGMLPGGQAVVAASTTTTVSSSSSTASYGQTVTFSATVAAQSPSSGIPNGTVTFFIDGVQQSPAAPIGSNGVAVFTSSTLPVSGSPHKIEAVYASNDNFTFSTGTLSGGQTITPAATTVMIASSENPSRPNEPVTFTATVTSANATPTGGTVTFIINGATKATANLVGGQATYAISTLAASTKAYTVDAKYSGSSNFSSQTGSTTETVDAAGKTTSKVAITPSESPAFYGDTVTFTAAVTGASGTPTGAVSFYLGSTMLATVNLDSNGDATLPISNLTVGTDAIKVSYYGDNTYAAATGTLSETVKPAVTTTTVTSSANPAVVGNPVTFTATVATSSLVPTGSVTFSIDGVTKATVALKNGQATYTTSALALSSTGHNVVAKYTATTDFAASSGSLSEVVDKPGTAAANVGVTSSADPSKVGAAVTFTATVSDPTNAGTPTGWVQFKIDGTLSPFVPLSAGTANYSTTFTTVATHTVIVYYYGDLTYAAETSATFQQIVTSVVPGSLTASIAYSSPTFTLTVDALTATGTGDTTYNAPVSFTVIGAPTGGTITGTSSATFSRGVATFTKLSPTVDGTYTLAITSGNLLYDFVFSTNGRVT